MTALNSPFAYRYAACLVKGLKATGYLHLFWTNRANISLHGPRLCYVQNLLWTEPVIDIDCFVCFHFSNQNEILPYTNRNNYPVNDSVSENTGHFYLKVLKVHFCEKRVRRQNKYNLVSDHEWFRDFYLNCFFFLAFRLYRCNSDTNRRLTIFHDCGNL